MSLTDRIQKAVGGIIPTYGYTPDFRGGGEPERYIVYTFAETGADYAEGENRVNQYLISLNVFTPPRQLDFPLYERIKQAMYAAGFGYVSGGPAGLSSLYPGITHYYLDFVGVEERE